MLASSTMTGDQVHEYVRVLPDDEPEFTIALRVPDADALAAFTWRWAGRPPAWALQDVHVTQDSAQARPLDSYALRRLPLERAWKVARKEILPRLVEVEDWMPGRSPWME